MASMKRHKTTKKGVFYIEGKPAHGKPEKIYYIRYRIGNRLIEEKAGRQFRDDMTPARAANIRSKRIEGDQLSNQAHRDAEMAAKAAEAARWTIDRLWTEYRSQRAWTRSLKVDDNRYQNHLQSKFGTKEPHEIIHLEVDRLRSGLEKKRSPQTVKHVMALLKRICAFGAKKGLCQPLPFQIELPRVNNQVTEDLTAEQLQRLLEAIAADDNTDAKAIMKLALYTGMRASEIFKLEWRHISFDRGLIHIQNPKGGVDQTIPMNEAAQSILQNHPRMESTFIFAGRRKKGEGVKDENGRPRATLQKASNRIKERAGLPADFRPMHGLRHVYASMLASSGQVDLYTLQKLLTHKSPAMTQRYAHLRDEALRCYRRSKMDPPMKKIGPPPEVVDFQC